MNRTFACFLSALMLNATTGVGIAAVTKDVSSAVDQFLRKPYGNYTDVPHQPYLGNQPGRGGKSRGGVWNAEQMQQSAEMPRQELIASMTPAMTGTHTLAVAPEPGKSFPWEGWIMGGGPSSGGSGGPGGTGGSGGAGSYPGTPGMGQGGSGSGVNTGNGNKLTEVPLVSWPVRGGMALDFTLYHNSQTNYSDELGYGWTWTYDIYINKSGATATLHWGDGLSVPFTYSSGSYHAPAGIFDELVENLDGTWTVTTKDQVVYSFNDDGFCNLITDRNGNSITLTLNAGNYVTAITDPSGRQIDIDVDVNGNFERITDELGRVWEFTIDGSDNLVEVEWPALDAVSYSDQFTYTNHRIVTQTDRRGKEWNYTYNGDGSLESETNPLGKTWSYTYNLTATTITDPLSHSVVHNYASGMLTSIVDKASFSTSYTSRNANKLVTALTDRRGKTWSYTYDAAGNLLTATDPLSHVSTYTYNGTNDLLTATDALSNVTTYVYDGNGSLETVTNDLGVDVATIVYDGYGQAISVENGLGKVWSYDYDADGNLESVTDPLSHTQTMDYDAISRLVSAEDALGNTTSVGYDDWGRAVTLTNPDLSTGTFGYLVTGQILSITDELNHTTTLSYDNAGRLVGKTNANSESESYGYDDANRRTSVTNGRGKTRTYAFTNRGEVSSLTLPDSSVEQWAYNGNGQVSAYTNPLSQTIAYAFDNAGRQTGVDYPTGTDTSFGYDNADRWTSMVDATGTTTWTYDDADRNTQLVTPQGTISYAYDNADRRTQMTDATGSTAYVYDDANRMTQLTNPFSLVTSWQYDNADRMIRQNNSNGTYALYDYDSRSRVTEISHMKSDTTTRFVRERTTYDVVGNVTQRILAGVTTTYAYDAIDQLLSETVGGVTTSYTYDANGNRATKTAGGVTETYINDDADKLDEVKVAGVTVKDFGYDAAGRTTSVTTSSGTTTLGYDFESRVTSITYPGSSTNTFVYNGLDTRVSKTDASGTKTYRRDGVDVTSPVLSDGTTAYTPGLSLRQGTTNRIQHADRLGSNIRQSNASEVVNTTQEWDAFGNLTSSTGMRTGEFGFAGSWGYQTDDASSLQLLGHRYYDASTGRFLTRDPIKDGRNWYGYCDNNPLSRLDPDGYEWHDPTGVSVDPAFKGKVWVVGEPGKGKRQVFLPVAPGGSSPQGMDVDIVIVQHPNGSQERYFLPGSNPPQDPNEVPSTYIVGPGGDVREGPPVWVRDPSLYPGISLGWVPWFPWPASKFPSKPAPYKRGPGPGDAPSVFGWTPGGPRNWNDDIEDAKNGIGRF